MEPPKASSMNAFQLINASLDLSAMFDRCVCCTCGLLCVASVLLAGGQQSF